MNTNQQPVHPTTIALLRIVELVEQMEDTRTPAEIDKAKTRAALNRARNTRRPRLTR